MSMELRVSDNDRDRAVQRLQQAFADGRLDSGEMEARLERALTATSRGELQAAVAGLPDDVVRLGSKSGRVLRVGDWRVPRALRIESVYGRVRLDLSRAVIEYPEIDIELQLTYGSAGIVLPPGATADVDEVVTEWGGVTCEVPGRAHPGSLHVRVTGKLTYGRLRVRNPRSWLGARR